MELTQLYCLYLSYSKHRQSPPSPYLQIHLPRCPRRPRRASLYPRSSREPQARTLHRSKSYLRPCHRNVRIGPQNRRRAGTSSRITSTGTYCPRPGYCWTISRTESRATVPAIRRRRRPSVGAPMMSRRTVETSWTTPPPTRTLPALPRRFLPDFPLPAPSVPSVSKMPPIQ